MPDTVKIDKVITSEDKLLKAIQEAADSDLGTSWEDAGIGSYEFWGAVGFDSHVVPTIEGETSIIVDMTRYDEDFLPRKGEGVVKFGGCPEVHRGSCDYSCAFVEAGYEWVIEKVEWTAISRSKGDKHLIVTYEIFGP